MNFHRFDPYKVDREKLQAKKAMETRERRKKYGVGGVKPMIDPAMKLKAQRKRNVSMRAKRLKITLPLIALALLAIVVPQQPSYACHIYSHWRYPYPQRCGIVTHYHVRHIVAPVKVIARLPPANVQPAKEQLNFKLPDLKGTWQIALDTPVALELYQGMQRQRAIKQLTGE